MMMIVGFPVFYRIEIEGAMVAASKLLTLEVT